MLTKISIIQFLNLLLFKIYLTDIIFLILKNLTLLVLAKILFLRAINLLTRQLISCLVKRLIGSLIHLSKCTRPDIAFAVNYAARFCENPTVSDWNKILNIFKYLNNTINYKITYNGTGSFTAYSDADFGGDRQDRKSTSGNLICVGNTPLYWISKKQTSVALSTTEAEFISATTCSKKILWIQNLIKEIFNQKLTITLYLDNLSCKKVLENGQFNNKMKHIDIQEHFILI